MSVSASWWPQMLDRQMLGLVSSGGVFSLPHRTHCVIKMFDDMQAPQIGQSNECHVMVEKLY